MSGEARRFTLVATFDGEQWASICRELDIASSGATAEEALDALERAVREALHFERESGVSPGAPVSEGDYRDFLNTSPVPERATVRTVYA